MGRASALQAVRVHFPLDSGSRVIDFETGADSDGLLVWRPVSMRVALGFSGLGGASDQSWSLYLTRGDRTVNPFTSTANIALLQFYNYDNTGLFNSPHSPVSIVDHEFSVDDEVAQDKVRVSFSSQMPVECLVKVLYRRATVSEARFSTLLRK